MKNYKFSAAIDVDDVLLECIPLACRLENELNKNQNMDPNKIVSWIKPGTPYDSLLKYFNEPVFYEQQRPYPGAQEFVWKLSKQVEIFIVTAVEANIMGIRMKQIMKYFPEINPKNIIPASRKDVISVDFAFDDGAHNILASKATYPVLFRRAWNQHLTGILAANNYDEFLNIVDCIQKSYACSDMDFSVPHVLSFVGGSGTGKTMITNKLLERNDFGRAKSTTTRAQRLGESYDAYNFICDEEFNRMKEDHLFAETTMYAGNQYGLELAEIDKVLGQRKHCVTVTDINGAMAFKMRYPTAIIYIKRDKDKLIDALIQRVESGETTRQDVVNRMVSLDDEKKNEKVCDYIINNNGTIEQALHEIDTILSFTKEEQL